jgi:hypothetical protein
MFGKNLHHYVGFEILTTAAVKITAVWNVMPEVEVYQCFRGVYCPLLQC